MKNIFKLVLLAAAAVIFALPNVSCNKDDEPSFDKNLLVGDWYLSYEKEVYKMPGEEPETDEESYTKTDSPTFLSFNSDGTGVNDDNYDGDSSYFTWSLNGDKLTLQYEDEDGPIRVTVKDLTANTFTTYNKDAEGGYSYEYTAIFTKIN